MASWSAAASDAADCSPTGRSAMPVRPACRCAYRSTPSHPIAASGAAFACTRRCRRANCRWPFAKSTISFTCATSRQGTPVAEWIRTATTSTRISCCKAASTPGWWSSPTMACCAWSASSMCSATACRRSIPFTIRTCSRPVWAPTTSSGRSPSVPPTRCLTCISATGFATAGRWRTRPTSRRSRGWWTASGPPCGCAWRHQG